MWLGPSLVKLEARQGSGQCRCDFPVQSYAMAAISQRKLLTPLKNPRSNEISHHLKGHSEQYMATSIDKRLKQENCELETSLGYTVNSRLAWTT